VAINNGLGDAAGAHPGHAVENFGAALLILAGTTILMAIVTGEALFRPGSFAGVRPSAAEPSAIDAPPPESSVAPAPGAQRYDGTSTPRPAPTWAATVSAGWHAMPPV
jgi:hypothetical protein